MPIFNNILAGAAGQTGGAAGYEITRSLRFNSADSAYLNRTPSSAGNRRTWTWSGWLKRSGLGVLNQLFVTQSSGTAYTALYIDSSNKLRFEDYESSAQSQLFTTQVFRDVSAWQHIVVAVDTTQATASNRVKLYVNGQQVTEFDTETYMSQDRETYISNTVDTRIGGGQAANQFLNGYLADVHFIDGQALAPSDFGEYDSNNVWQPKDCKDDLTYGTNGFYLSFSDNSSSSALGLDQRPGATQDPTATTYGTIMGGSVGNVFDGIASYTSELDLRPNGSGVTLDTAVTASSKVRIYGMAESGTYQVNGTSTGIAPSVSPNRGWTDVSSALTFPITISSFGIGGGSSDDGGRLAAIEIDDVILTGTANDWTVNNLSVASGAGNDSLIDTPTNYEAAVGNAGGNYATLNPLDKSTTNQGTYANGNLEFTKTSTSYASAKASIGMTSGKWYCEVTKTSTGTNTVIGVHDETAIQDYLDRSAAGYGWRSDGVKVNNNTQGTNIGGYAEGDVMGLAFDADAKALYFYKNGTLAGSFTGITPSDATHFFAFSAYDGKTIKVNFGQRPFAYTPPTGYKSLCTQNLDPPTIADGSTAMDVVTWTGDTTSAANAGDRSFSSLNMSPDFVWIKQRNQAYSTGHQLYDAVRSAGSEKELNTSSTAIEGAGNIEQYGWLNSFDSNGFTVRGGSVGNTYVNATGVNYVAWAWDAGDSTVSNTDGTITSQVRANPSAGFSIVSYTGNGTSPSTIGHGLNAVPEMILVKNRSDTWNWAVYHKGLIDGSTVRYLILNSTSAQVTGSGHWQNTVPSSSVFTVGNDDQVNASVGTDTYIAYCFAPVEGYSAFGSYTGNGSADGPFVFTGHASRWIMIKRTDSTGSWIIYDTQRNLYNTMDLQLLANEANAETTTTTGVVDTVSNGFKLRGTGSNTNASGGTYIYIAFAEHPLSLNGGLAR